MRSQICIQITHTCIFILLNIYVGSGVRLPWLDSERGRSFYSRSGPIRTHPTPLAFIKNMIRAAHSGEKNNPSMDAKTLKSYKYGPGILISLCNDKRCNICPKTSNLMLCMLSKIFSRQYTEILFVFFSPENRFWLFMQIVSGDNLHEMSNSVFWKKKKKKKKKMSSVCRLLMHLNA